MNDFWSAKLAEMNQSALAPLPPPQIPQEPPAPSIRITGNMPCPAAPSTTSPPHQSAGSDEDVRRKAELRERAERSATDMEQVRKLARHEALAAQMSGARPGISPAVAAYRAATGGRVVVGRDFGSDGDTIPLAGDVTSETISGVYIGRQEADDGTAAALAHLYGEGIPRHANGRVIVPPKDTGSGGSSGIAGYTTGFKGVSYLKV